MRISDWSSDVCSSDLANGNIVETNQEARRILAEKDGIWLSGNNICIESSQESRDLQRILRSAMAGTNSGEGPGVVEAIARTEERRVGKEWVSKCRSWWSSKH